MSDFTQSILNSIPTNPNQLSVDLEGPGLLIAGAAVSLLEFERLYDSYVTLQLQGGKESSPCTVGGAYAALHEMIRIGGRVDWEFNFTFLDWSLGYFVNRAQHNIAAALDRSCNALLASSWGVSASDETVDDRLMGMWIGMKLFILERQCEAISNRIPSTRLLLSSLREAFDDTVLCNTHNAAKWLAGHCKADTEVARNRAKTLGSLLRSIPAALATRFDAPRVPPCEESAQALCVALAVSRTNAFKHEILGQAQARTAARFGLEAALAAKALQCISRFCEAASQEIALHVEERKPSRSEGDE